MSDYRVFLDDQFNPVPPARASLVKVVGAGKVAFYRPHSSPPQQKAAAAGRWVTVGGRHFQIGGEATQEHFNTKDPAQMEMVAKETGARRVFEFSTGDGSTLDKNVRLATNTGKDGQPARGKLRISIMEGADRQDFERPMAQLPALVAQMQAKKYAPLGQHRIGRAQVMKAAPRVLTQDQMVDEIMEANPPGQVKRGEMTPEQWRECYLSDEPGGYVLMNVSPRVLHLHSPLRDVKRVQAYAEEPGTTAPPIVLDANEIWHAPGPGLTPFPHIVIDGRHRLLAALERGDRSIRAYVPRRLAPELAEESRRAEQESVRQEKALFHRLKAIVGGMTA